MPSKQFLPLPWTFSLINEFSPFLRELDVLERVKSDFITQAEVFLAEYAWKRGSGSKM